MVGDVPDVITQDRSQKCEIGGGQIMKVEGQQVERRRRENRGAVGAEDRGAEGGWVWGGGISSRFWGGDCAISPENTPSPEFF